MAAELARPDVAARRKEWIEQRQPRMRREPGRLVFLDETAVNTKMTRLRGRARRGQRLRARAPYARWGTQTFIAGLRADRLVAPWVIEGPINRTSFNTYIETQLAPTLSRGDVVIADNLSVHDSAVAKATLRQRGAWFLFLPQYSPDLNPIEMLFSKLKHALRKAARRAQDAKYHALRLPTAYGPAQRVCQLLRQSRIRSNLESSRSAWSDPLASCGNELRKRWPQTLAQGLLTGLLNSENKAGVDRSASRSTPEAPCWRPTMWAASCGAVAARSKPHP